MQSPIINVMSGAAIKAGKGLMRDFGEVDQLQISKKGPSNFVTKSDIRTEKFLVKELQKARPACGFLLEEGGEIAGKDATHRWIIDPLDGTTNFIHAIPYFCISIALERTNADGKREIIAGVIYDPINNELFSAEKGKGAECNGRRLYTSTRTDLSEAMLVTNNPRFSANPTPEHVPLFETIVNTGAILRYFGATALDLAHLAAGRIDAAWYYSAQPWDLAAGLLLVQEASGLAIALDGSPAQPYCKAVLASNQPLFPAMQKLLAKA